MRRPVIDPSAWVAPNATVLGAATLGSGASVWYGAVVRADREEIHLGAGSNVQDNCTLHADPGFPLLVGADVTIGHNAVCHGATIGDGCLVGMGAVVMNGAELGAGTLVAAGAVVREGMVVPPGSLVAGVPAKVVRTLDAEQSAALRENAARYVRLAREHADDAATGGPA
ncbi:gamma carbonic anhydrase family protein [Nocardioides alkalitolerans]|uniref:gamma carbonic anhydrase family protein n=1 Tax=Nocardioides alkalitolerans TaxID=281714 RepID=UPI00041C9256|nr:gamma carbonic anhydrase family protein [Nocardioides alkalitolerans]